MTDRLTPDRDDRALPAYRDLGPDPEPLGERFEILLAREVAREVPCQTRRRAERPLAAVGDEARVDVAPSPRPELLAGAA